MIEDVPQAAPTSADHVGEMEERRSLPSEDRTLVYLEVPGDARRRDDLLADAVRRMRGELRRHDAVGRYGDGILALLSGVRAELGEQVARRVLDALELEVAARIEEVAPGERLDDAAARARRDAAAR